MLNITHAAAAADGNDANSLCAFIHHPLSSMIALKSTPLATPTRCAATQPLQHCIRVALRTQFCSASRPKVARSIQACRLPEYTLRHMATFRNATVTITDPVPRYAL